MGGAAFEQVVAGGLQRDGAFQDLRDFGERVARVRAQGFAHVEFVVVEQAQMEFAVCRQAHPVAGSAVRLADRADESRNYRLAGARGVVGFISPVSEPYCGTCNRMRLTADGKFHLCLLNDDELDVRKALRSNSADVIADVARILKRAVELKPTGHHLLEGRSTQDRSMYQIGG